MFWPRKTLTHFFDYFYYHMTCHLTFHFNLFFEFSLTLYMVAVEVQNSFRPWWNCFPPRNHVRSANPFSCHCGVLLSCHSVTPNHTNKILWKFVIVEPWKLPLKNPTPFLGIHNSERSSISSTLNITTWKYLNVL